MSDLSEFLLARIAEDEAVARGSMPGPWALVEDRGSRGTDSSVWSSGGGYPITEAAVNAPTAEHIAHWNPVRAGAECEAKRRIVEKCRDSAEPPYNPYDCEPGRSVLRLLALPYADHPDYCAEWRP